MSGALALDFSNLDSVSWPLIAKIYADDVYRARYNEYVLTAIGGAFETNTMQAAYDSYAALVAPYATTELSGYSFLNSDSDFYQAIEKLKAHAESRAQAVETYLDSQ